MAGSIPSRETIRQNKNLTLCTLSGLAKWRGGERQVQRVYCGGGTGKGSNQTGSVGEGFIGLQINFLNKGFRKRKEGQEMLNKHVLSTYFVLAWELDTGKKKR